ncbi:uncharacterized protein LOC141639657 [Silene latifolia]|uniref:uncharacterized protein LOC141639657 n=1 Tax=Silene latifolia TaxID=37657 RepID=UPI003D76AA4C
MCKDFLWGIADGHRRMVFKSWTGFCLPRKESGLDIKEILSWNMTELLSWIRKIELDSPTIWVKWIKAYVLKGVDIWDFQLTPAYSWGWSSVIACRDCLLQATGNRMVAKDLLAAPDYKQQAYELFRTKCSSFASYKIFGEPLVYPKHEFIGILAAQNRLPTIDNLCCRGLFLVNRCALCELQLESNSHLFFECSFFREVWQAVASWAAVTSSARLCSLLRWYKTHKKGRSILKKFRRCVLVMPIYCLWKERNSRIFNGVASLPSDIIWKVKYLSSLRVKGHDSLVSQLVRI